ncbi:S41 family peptidase [Roseimaritima sediminicola]|uniref:S41 family peptidase n=1 Tax=Roseimaritima sediminicola TaxID=2662066 RepID=UPI0012984487|nr:S41 family peptidase [Roseimaritima sediminicola]
MPLRNYHILMVVAVVSILCHVTARRTHSALVVGDAIDKIEKHYVDPVEHRTLVEAALRGLQTQLDEHSQFIPPDKFEEFEQSLAQEFAGIGVLVEQPETDEPVRVITPLVGSPAYRAGVLPGDRIVGIDGEDASGLSLAEVSERLGGPIGSRVEIDVRRDEDERVTLSVTREQIPLDSVLGDYRDENSDWVYRVRNHPRIAMIRCTSFGEKTVSEMRRVLNSLDNDFDALILDLRENSGGLLNAAVEICDMFIESGEIVSTRGRDASKKATSELATPGTLVDPEKPMVVLIDQNSASASEIVAACLQDHGRATIAGTRSYGKGTVQNVLIMEYGRSAFKLTTARYYRPSGQNIHRTSDASEEDVWGVRPDPSLRVRLDDQQRQAVRRRWRRATFPVWEDREITWLSRGPEDAPDAAAEPPVELPDRSQDLPEHSPEDESRSDDPQDDAAADDGGAAAADDSDDAASSLDPDDPRVDPLLRRVLDYLHDSVVPRAQPARAA